jgi:Uma2 family endonuclease
MVPIARWRFTVTDYHQMARAGILGEDDRVELIEGEIVEMSPIGGPHLQCVNRLTRLCVLRFGDAAIVSVQNPVRLDRYNEPQPDVVLARQREDEYGSGPPEPGDILLLIEVADSSLRYDRQIKLPLYARSGVPEVWIVDLGRATVSSYRDPTADGYQQSLTAGRGSTLRPQAFPDQEIAVTEILGEQ